MLEKKLSNNLILYIILAIATFLRFYNYFEIPFTHDEFSALFRLNFNNFGDLIEKGVKIDGHPAGVQVFLYYWTKLFGTQTWVVKLPFTLLGILSVYLIYMIGKKWFNETVGLISAAFIATTEFAVVYSQIARPYISGLCFSLLMVYYLTNLIMSPQKSFLKNIVFFIISASLCAYNHHFSLLFAVIVSISGIFLIDKKYLLKYILSGIAIFILYIPHLEIFFYQLHVGGVEGWLGKPNNDFIIKFIFYIFNHSVIVLIISFAIFLYSFSHFKKNIINIRLILISFLWFIFPFLIGFFYSKYFNAVLQYSVLIFSFPFLLFVFYGFLKKQTLRINFILVIVIIIANIFTLVYGRKHYEIFYKSIFKYVLIDYINVKSQNKNTIYIIDSQKKITQYYSHKLNIDTNYIIYSDIFENLNSLKIFLENESSTHEYLYLGCVSSIHPNVIPLIQEYFPNIEMQNNYFGGTTFLFSKNTNLRQNIIEKQTFDLPISQNWHSIDSLSIIKSEELPDNNYYYISNDIEWGPTFSIPLNDIILNKKNFIDISIDAKSKTSLEEIILVASLDSKGKNIHWSGTDFSTYYLSKYLNDWQVHHHSIKLSDIYLNNNDIILKIFIWNKSKKSFYIDNFNISIRDGNPIIYGAENRF